MKWFYCRQKKNSNSFLCLSRSRSLFCALCTSPRHFSSAKRTEVRLFFFAFSSNRTIKKALESSFMAVHCVDTDLIPRLPVYWTLHISVSFFHSLLGECRSHSVVPHFSFVGKNTRNMYIYTWAMFVTKLAR